MITCSFLLPWNFQPRRGDINIKCYPLLSPNKSFSWLCNSPNDYIQHILCQLVHFETISRLYRQFKINNFTKILHQTWRIGKSLDTHNALVGLPMQCACVRENIGILYFLTCRDDSSLSTLDRSHILSRLCGADVANKKNWYINHYYTNFFIII